MRKAHEGHLPSIAKGGVRLLCWESGMVGVWQLSAPPPPAADVTQAPSMLLARAWDGEPICTRTRGGKR
jgi:hypothetical protein